MPKVPGKASWQVLRSVLGLPYCFLVSTTWPELCPLATQQPLWVCGAPLPSWMAVQALCSFQQTFFVFLVLNLESHPLHSQCPALMSPSPKPEPFLTQQARLF